jgi:hypothetical protein
MDFNWVEDIMPFKKGDKFLWTTKYQKGVWLGERVLDEEYRYIITYMDYSDEKVFFSWFDDFTICSDTITFKELNKLVNDGIVKFCI